MSDSSPPPTSPSPGSTENRSNQPPPQRMNPYVGPRALREGEQIFGRDRELRELLNRLIADRLVLLYSPSGAGKSSLVQAGLVPQMRQEKFTVLPTVRVGLEPPELDGPQSDAGSMEREIPDRINRYIFSALLSLEQDLPSEQQQKSTALAQLSFAEYLKKRPRQPDEPYSRLLVFDQFEEILTHAPLDREGKFVFFDQVGEALLDHDLWALFVIREDFLAGLDPYLPLIPTYLRSTFRLDLLESQTAMLAVQKPVEDLQIIFHKEAAQKLVDDLRRVWVQQPDGSQREEPGLYVEPVQLQVVCRRLFKELDLEHDLRKTDITTADVALLGDVNKALGEYYSAEMFGIAGQSDIPERSIRDWFGERLITENLLRGQVLMGEGFSGGLENTAIRMLEDAHLVRAENRRNSTWFELAHDRLVRPILENNQEWAQTHLQDFQRRASEWRKKSRPSTLLLRGRDLLKAEEWAQANPSELNDTDHELLQSSQQWRTQNLSLVQRKAAEWEKRARSPELLLNEAEISQAQTWILENPDEAGPLEQEYIASSQKAINQAAQQQREREIQLEFERQRAKDQEIQNQKLRSRNLQLIALSALAFIAFLVAIYFAVQFNAVADENASIATQGAVTAVYNANQRDINATQAASNADEARRLDMENYRIQQEAATLESEILQSQSTAVALQATSAALAIQSNENALGRATAEYNAGLAQASRLASLSQGNFGKDPPLSALLGIAAYQAFPASWEGRNALLTSLQVNAQQQVRPFGSPIQSQILTLQNITFSPDGKFLAWCGLDGMTRVWDLDRNVLLNKYQIFPQHGINSLAFSPTDSNLLVTGSGNGYVTFWNLETGEREPIEAIYRSPSGIRYIAGQVINLSFSHDGRFLSVSGVNGYPQIWDAAQRSPISVIDTGSVTVRKIVWSPSGDRLAGAAYDRDGGVVYLWDPVNGTQLDRLDSEDKLVFSLDWSPDGKWLAFAGGNLENQAYLRKIVLYDTLTRQNIEITAQSKNIRTLAFDQENKVLAAGSDDGTLRLWDISLAGANGIVQSIEGSLNNFITRPPVQGLAFSRKGLNRLAYFTNDDRVAIFEIGWTRPLNTSIAAPVVTEYNPVPPSQDSKPVSGYLAMGYGANGEVYTVAHQDSSLIVNSIDSDFQGRIRSGSIFNVSIGPSNWISTNSQQGKVQIWDMSTSQLVLEQYTTSVPIISMAIRPNGEQIAIGWCRSCNPPLDGIGIFEIGADQPEFSTPTELEINSLAFDDDGLKLAGGSSDGRIQLWDLASREQIGLDLIWNQEEPITALAFSPDGRTLAAGNQRGRISLWDVASQRQIGQDFLASDAPITGLLFTRDGLSLLSLAQNGEIQSLDLDIQTWIERLCTLAKRDFTTEEAKTFFPDQTVNSVCKDDLQKPTETPSP